MAYARVLNREKIVARLAKIPPAVKAAVQAQLKTNVDGLVEAMKRAAPVGSDMERNPGELRDSIHSYPNPQRELSFRIIADAKDVKGRFIGGHVEWGHLTVGGRHVPAVPFFFPTYRAQKKPMRRRLADAARKSFRAWAVG